MLTTNQTTPIKASDVQSGDVVSCYGETFTVHRAELASPSLVILHSAEANNKPDWHSLRSHTYIERHVSTVERNVTLLKSGDVVIDPRGETREVFDTWRNKSEETLVRYARKNGIPCEMIHVVYPNGSNMNCIHGPAKMD